MRTKRWLQAVDLRAVIVHLDNDSSMRAVLAGSDDDGLLLKAVTILGANPVEVAGDVWVPRANVVFIQTASA